MKTVLHPIPGRSLAGRLCFLALLIAVFAHGLDNTGMGAEPAGGKPTVGELDRLARQHQEKQKQGWNSFRLFGEHRELALDIALVGIERHAAEHAWAQELGLIFSGQAFEARKLDSKGRREKFSNCCKFLQQGIAAQSMALAQQGGNEQLQQGLGMLKGSLALAAVEVGRVKLADRLAREQLTDHSDSKPRNSGKVIYDMNCILGRVALQQGDKTAAGEYLLKAGDIPGSPGLNSFGPRLTLARELLEAGQRTVVLKHLDQVEKFWVGDGKESNQSNRRRLARRHQAQLDEWRTEIKAGNVPSDSKWR